MRLPNAPLEAHSYKHMHGHGPPRRRFDLDFKKRTSTPLCASSMLACFLVNNKGMRMTVPGTLEQAEAGMPSVAAAVCRRLWVCRYIQ